MKTFDISTSPIAGLLAEIEKGEVVALADGIIIIAKVVPIRESSPPASCFDDPDEVDARTKDPNRPPRRSGALKGIWMAPDFDAPLEEFKEYMG